MQAEHAPGHETDNRPTPACHNGRKLDARYLERRREHARKRTRQQKHGKVNEHTPFETYQRPFQEWVRKRKEKDDTKAQENEDNANNRKN